MMVDHLIVVLGQMSMVTTIRSLRRLHLRMEPSRLFKLSDSECSRMMFCYIRKTKKLLNWYLAHLLLNKYK
jgi:hypothetical protein